MEDMEKKNTPLNTIKKHGRKLATNLVDKFFKSVDARADDISIVLRAHLFIENQIDEIVEMAMPRGDLLCEFTFSQKILILRALKFFDNSVIDSLQKLNKVRNNCSHSLGYEITMADIDSLGKPFGKKYNQLKLDHGDKDKKHLLISILGFTLGELCAQYFILSYVEKS